MSEQVTKLFLICIFVLSFVALKAQNKGVPEELSSAIESPRHLRVMFYNCENLFDIYDDSLCNDEEFLPNGDKNWNSYRYYTKLTQISKIITAVGGWKPPEIVGLCEIENNYVLNELINKTQLYQFNYEIIHQESPDKRGIDVALLYQPKSFKPIYTEFIKVNFPGKNIRTTRDILYTRGLTNLNDTLHVFINHWPSRWGGQLETEEKRVFTASLLRSKVDSIGNSNPDALILITGDFNDEPNNKSMKQTLKSNSNLSNIKSSELYNLSTKTQLERDIGSHKYQGHWGMLDQIIVSGSLLNKNGKIYTTNEKMNIFNPPFLLETDETHLGEKPYRTYNGFKYLGGYSDHLPIFIDLIKNH